MIAGRRALLQLAGALLGARAAGCQKAVVAPRAPFRPEHLVDLTHTLSPRFPFIPVQNKTFPFRLAPIATLTADGVYANRWELTEHVGTHLDAPCHFAEGGASVEQVPAKALIVPLAVVSIAERAARAPDAALERYDVLAWERKHGRVPEGAAVLLHTGWDARAGDAPRFVNLGPDGKMHFPGFSEAAVALLVEERTVSGIGIDTLSIDPGIDEGYGGHKRLFRSGKWALECLAHLGDVPPTGATAFVGPVKVEGASGAPARVFAFW